MLEEALKVYGRSIGIEGLALNEEGSLALSIDGQETYLQHFEQRAVLFIVCPLGGLSKDTTLRLCELEVIAQASCFGRELAGGYIGTENDRIAYSIELACEAITGEELLACMRSVIRIAKQLKQKLQMSTTPDETEDPSLSHSQNWLSI